MTHEVFLNKKEFAKAIGVTPQALHAKEKRGEINPKIGSMYTQSQVSTYLNNKKLGITPFTENIKFLMNLYGYTKYLLSEELTIPRSTLTRMLSQNSQHHKSATVEKIVKYFGYTKELQYTHISALTFRMIPVFDSKLQKTNGFYKINVHNQKKSEDEMLAYGTCNIAGYPLLENRNIVFSKSRPLVEDTIIVSTTSSVIVGYVKKLHRDKLELQDMLSQKPFECTYNDVFGIIIEII
jgi:transcriptional regulator with XRE-family HTH domain